MTLTVHEVADLMNDSEATVHRWIKENAIPCHRVGSQYRFHRTEFLEWATARGMALSLDALPASRRPLELTQPRFAAALRAGGVYPSVEGHDRDSVLRAVLKRMPLAGDEERELLFEVMRAREALESTDVGDGIASLHARYPTLLATTEPSVTLCFLRHPIELDAMQGCKVHTIFSLVTRDVRSHAYLHATLSAALEHADFRRAVLDRLSAPRVLAAAVNADLKLGGDDEGSGE